jgi:catechol 2,3-dioxygenase-like lactoylglutathione lyase family enzyme
MEEIGMSSAIDAHADLHSEQGRRSGEHLGRSQNPVIKVRDLAWLEFQKPDLTGTETFAHVFGFSTVLRTDNELHLRGTDAGAPCLLIRRGPSSRFTGMAFRAADESDLLRLADATGVRTRALPETIGGVTVDLVDPGGLPVRVVARTHQHEAVPSQQAHAYNFGREVQRANATQRPAREPARVLRLGHVVMQTTKYREALNWYLDQFGMIVSDFLYFPGQRERGPTMSFIRCDNGRTPVDHHTLAMALGPTNRYLHSAYQVCDLDALAAGGQYLKDQGYQRSWGIGRHIQGSQIFDYWRDPEGLMVEHFTDGDMFDSTLEPGWAPFTASGLSQWGPKATKDFLGVNAKSLPHEARSMLGALREPNEFDFRGLVGLMKVANS